MSALLVKEAPKELHQWLKDEAQYNRRSLNQQILVCLEWCMQTYGRAQARNPFAVVQSADVKPVTASTYLRGRDLASHLTGIAAISDEDADEIKASARELRVSRTREFDYGCFA